MKKMAMRFKVKYDYGVYYVYVKHAWFKRWYNIGPSIDFDEAENLIMRYRELYAAHLK